MNLRIDAFEQELSAQRPRLLADEELVRGLAGSGFGDQGASEALRAAQALDQLVADARSSLGLIEDYVQPGALVLEVGGGVGLTYAWLVRQGIAVTALEPALSGHESSYRTGQRLLSLLGVRDDGFLPLCAEDAPSLGRFYDLIFSNNVLEHLTNLPGSLQALRQCLREDGVMRHNCPNYLVPYEPHFGLPLPPVWPRLLEFLRPDLRGSELWKELNFITSLRLRRLAKQLDLQTEFDRDHLYRTFLRLGHESSFRSKHPQLFRLSRVLERCHLLPLLRHMPPLLATPMQVTLRPT